MGSVALPDVDEELAARLRVAITRLHRRLRQESYGGLSPTQLTVLGSVGRLGNPTLGDLAEAERVRPPTMTRLVASLEAAGMVTRHGDEVDRRVSRVVLTEEGRGALDKVRRLENAFLTRRLARLDRSTRASAAGLTSLLERLVEER